METNKVNDQSTTEPNSNDAASGAQSAKSIMLAEDNGMLVGKTFEEQWRIARVMHASGMVPKQLDTPEKIFVARQLCFELGLPPVTGLRQICVVNGTPSIWGDLPMSLVMRSGKLQSIKEWLFAKDGTEISVENKNLSTEVFGAGCTVQRKAMGDITRTFTVDDARKANLWGNKVWAVYPKRMLQCRARSHALKDIFPDVLSGISIAEYDFNHIPDVDGSEPTLDARRPRASSLNDRFGKKDVPVDVPIDAELTEEIPMT